MRRRFARGLLLMATAVVALSFVAPAILSASHQPLSCGREHCFSCRVLAEGFDFLHRLFAAPLAIAPLWSLLVAARVRFFKRGICVSILSPVERGVRLNN